jgi:hypothetical protein
VGEHDGEQRERVPELVADGSFELRKSIRRQACLERVRPKGTKRHSEETETRRDDEEGAVHVTSR